MGQSVLKVHSIGKARFCPYAYYGATSEDGFTMPIEDAAFLQAFREGFFA